MKSIQKRRHAIAGLAVTLAERAFRRLATRLGDPQSQQAVSGRQCRELRLGRRGWWGKSGENWGNMG